MWHVILSHFDNYWMNYSEKIRKDGFNRLMI